MTCGNTLQTVDVLGMVLKAKGFRKVVSLLESFDSETIKSHDILGSQSTV